MMKTIERQSAGSVQGQYLPYPKYKGSGEEWIGSIPEHWRVDRLKNMATVNDETLPEETSPDREMVYVDIGSVDATYGIVQKEDYVFSAAPSRARRLVRDGDVIVSTVRTYLRAIAPIRDPDPNLVVSTGFAVVRPRSGLLGSFAAYALRAPYFVENVVANSVGVSFPAINASEMSCMPVVTPPLPEQQAIAAFLDRDTGKIDALITKKERLIALLQEKRTALITHAVTKGLDPNVPMKDSGVEWLGHIPAHWEVKRLKHISPRQSVGLVINPSTYVDDSGTVPFLFGANISPFHIDSKKARRITEESNRSLSQSILRCGDLVTVRVGYPGVTAVVPPNLDRANCASMMIVRKHDSFSSDWLCYVMNSRIGFHQVELVQYGAAQKQFNISHAVEFRYPVPPIEEQVVLVGFLDTQCAAIDALIDQIEHGCDRLKEYRIALISAAVTGKIDVRNETRLTS